MDQFDWQSNLEGNRLVDVVDSLQKEVIIFKMFFMCYITKRFSLCGLFLKKTNSVVDCLCIQDR